MTISAKIIADSRSEYSRLTSLQLRYPRFIHAEFMTHRVFSRNASSSRAIPVERLIADVLADTAMPMHWGANQKGMQAESECNEQVIVGFGSDDYAFGTREEAWREARDRAIEMAKSFNTAGYHKQIVNRLLEPFSHINVLVSSTEWENFFQLRDHPDAQPEIQVLARAIKKAMAENTPKLLQPGEWHLPYVTDEDYGWEYQCLEGDTPKHFATHSNEDLIKISCARCARVSYLTHDGKQPSIESDLKLYDRLVGSVPLHASPAEHVATPDGRYSFAGEWHNSDQHGNFKGWRQHRKMLPNG